MYYMMLEVFSLTLLVCCVNGCQLIPHFRVSKPQREQEIVWFKQFNFSRGSWTPRSPGPSGLITKNVWICQPLHDHCMPPIPRSNSIVVPKAQNMCFRKHAQLKSVGTRFVYGFIFMIHMHMHKFKYIFIYNSHEYTTCIMYTQFQGSIVLCSCTVYNVY